MARNDPEEPDRAPYSFDSHSLGAGLDRVEEGHLAGTSRYTWLGFVGAMAECGIGSSACYKLIGHVLLGQPSVCWQPQPAVAAEHQGRQSC